MSNKITVEELVSLANNIIGIPFSKIDKNERLTTGKGAIGTMIEESWFNQAPHSDEFPDFKHLGIELKVTPYLKTKKIRSKERLVNNMINYMQEYKYASFEESSFFQKSNTLLLMFYEYIKDEPKGNFYVSHSKFITLDKDKHQANKFLFLIPDKDLEIIRQDWEKIVDKIRQGKAHEISEGDTNYLGACTKAADSSVLVKQPFSNILAKPRAFSLKQSYMTYLLNNYVIKNVKAERLIKNDTELKNKTFEQIIVEKFAPYIGKTDVELAKLFGLEVNNKSFRDRIIASILGIKGNINKSEEFQKADIKAKTIRVEDNGKIRESMSFPTIDFNKIVEDEWEDSDFFQQIGVGRFMFSLFKKHGKHYKLAKVKFWNMPAKDLELAKKVWLQTKTLVLQGKIEIGGEYGFSVTNFPKQADNPVSHVRPHDIDAKKGRILLPDGRSIIKYSFWLNRTYIKKVISE